MKKGRKEMNSADVVDNDVRQNIWIALDNNKLSITQLEDRLKINRGTLKHHLNILEKNEIIGSSREEHLAGKPRLFFRKQKDTTDNLNDKILSFIENNKNVNWEDIIKKFNSYKPVEIISKITFLEVDNKIQRKYSIKDNSK